jgi:hypothetical protein
MVDYTSIIPIVIALVVVFYAVLWFFDAFFSVPHGRHKGPYTLVLKQPPEIQEVRKNITDITEYIFREWGPKEQLFKQIVEAIEGGSFKMDDKTRQAIVSKLKSMKPDEMILASSSNTDYRLQVLATRSLLGGKGIIWVLSRRRFKDSGDAKVFPEDYALIAERNAFTLQGAMTRGFIEGLYFPSVARIEKIPGIGRNLKSGFFIPDIDKNDAELVETGRNLATLMSQVYPYIPTVGAYEREIKGLKRQIEVVTEEAKELRRRIHKMHAYWKADSESEKALDKLSKKTAQQKVSSWTSGISIMVIPTLGAIVLGVLFYSSLVGAVVGAFIGSLLVAFLVLKGK